MKNDSTFASGTMAMKLNEKRRAASQLRKWAKVDRAMKTRSKFNQEPKMNHLREASQDGSPSALTNATIRCEYE